MPLSHSVVPVDVEWLSSSDGDGVNRGNHADTRMGDIRMVDMSTRRADNRTAWNRLEGRIPIRNRYSTGAATKGQRTAEDNNRSFRRIQRRLIPLHS